MHGYFKYLPFFYIILAAPFMIILHFYAQAELTHFRGTEEFYLTVAFCKCARNYLESLECCNPDVNRSNRYSGRCCLEALVVRCYTI